MRPDLVEKYRSQRVPRYTSYPSSPHFTADIGGDAYRRWLGELGGTSHLSLYVHVPFCRSMCWYCGCHTTIVPHDDPVLRYLAALTKEAKTVGALVPDGPAVSHLHFGGGTPTLMPAASFITLMRELRHAFAFSPSADIAVEIDPRTLKDDMPDALAVSGVTRASLGVQSFDPEVQKAINRIQTPEMTAAAVGSLRRAGIRGLNLDLIYGLPKQTVRSCIETVETALAFDPDRFSVFGYAHMPGFKGHQSRIAEADLPDAEERVRQTLAIEDTLLANGYVRIGFDHFAKPTDPIAVAAANGTLRRNFQGYTTDDADALIGLGASAIGRLPDGFIANIVPVPGYMKAVEADGLAVGRGFAIQPEDRLRSDLIERLMCDFEVDVEAVALRHGIHPARVMPDPDALEEMEADGLIELIGTRIRVRDDVHALVRSVAALFDAYLDPAGLRHSKAI